MRRNVEIKEEEIKKYIDELYSYFDTGYEFEDFLKAYLEKLGLDEVVVTKKSGDGGFDLTAIRPGIGGFSSADTINYFIQAKRYNPAGSKIPVSMIRQLKGVLPYGNKGIFITTTEFSKDAIAEANNDPTRPIVLIGGKQLIESCIDNELAFIFIPVFSQKLMDEVMKKNRNQDNNSENGDCIIEVEKQITANDIRARILRVPKAIIDKIQPSDSIGIKLGDDEVKDYKYNSSGLFVSGITPFYKKYGLIDDNNVFTPKKSIWKYYADRLEVKIEE